eukprot:CAMPEP_0178387076 /NCGR_PEP_ID=MMETSP0689_2-20121128/8889_1 /TAXON_ID=160604 /ORGANISM="Amphidinium massartii, Strain CS-259" /LENGTH=301 /DNA_ID=CAMNT_0020007433 /DNA_START=53 /DNA_END=955 /DNA_ORIENTATION=-
MNFNRVSNKITSSYIMDPYAMLMHYRRAFKLLKLIQNNGAKVLVLGNKNQLGINWKSKFEGMEYHTGAVDDRVISSAPKHYDLILCTDPVLYCKALQRMTVPVMMCATARDINDYPEILQVTDYLLPSPTRRHDKALRQLIFKETMEDEEVELEPPGSPEEPAPQKAASKGTSTSQEPGGQAEDPPAHAGDSTTKASAPEDLGGGKPQAPSDKKVGDQETAGSKKQANKQPNISSMVHGRQSEGPGVKAMTTEGAGTDDDGAPAAVGVSPADAPEFQRHLKESGSNPSRALKMSKAALKQA